MSTELLDRARAGDGEAFRQVAEPHRRELQLHCYRMLGSLQDAEDALQDTLLAAWRGLAAFEGRSSLRTWLYQVATNRCLNILRANRRRPVVDPLPPGVEIPEPSRTGEVIWLEPYPDALLGGPNEPPGPEGRYEASEAISIAFLTALQALSARQRAVLILRDVLGYRASEVATILDASEESVTSALKRARAIVQQRLAPTAGHEPPPRPGSPEERELVDRLTRAYESGDIDALVALLHLVLGDLVLVDGADEPAREHHADPVGQVEHVVDVVADEEDPDALRLQLGDELVHLGGLRRTERRGGLVHDQDRALKWTARAMATAWRCPPDSHPTGVLRFVNRGLSRRITSRVADAIAESSRAPVRVGSRGRGTRWPRRRCCRRARASGRSSRSRVLWRRGLGSSRARRR